MTYRHDRRVDHTAIGIAVVVQSMVDAVSSGIMFTVDPISRKDQVVIEASWGLGESIASGIVILERLSGTRFGTFKKPVFKIVAKFAQTYMMFRENQRFYLDEQLFRARRLFLEYGRRLADQGQLDHQNDVFFLTKEEMFDMAEGRGGEMRSAVLSRIGEFEKYGDELPPKFLQGRMEFEDALTIIGDTARMTGTAASPGMVTGVVRMVRSIDELKTVEYGEILVATNTDPGWTAVFSKIGGLITETGGILSHGAVVSREYGIPAVTAVKGATKIFKSGQRITLNGNEGLIYISEG
jgi:pyruvate,water dikinase